FPMFFPKIEKLERQDQESPYKELIDWFFTGSGFELLDDATDDEYRKQLDAIAPLDDLVKKYMPELPSQELYFVKEYVLWGLAENNKLSRERFVEGYQFKDLYGSYISKL